MVTILDKTEKIIPSITPENLKDDTPLMKPVMIMITVNNINKKNLASYIVLNEVSVTCNKSEMHCFNRPNGWEKRR